MKQITSIHGAGIKGRNFSHDVGPVTVFVGKNGSGKSSRLAAAYLALDGAVPWLGSTNGAIFAGLASSQNMTSTVEFDDGASISRTYKQAGEKVTSKTTRVKLPDDWSLPPVLLRPASYFELSERERIKFVFSRAQSKGGELSGAFEQIRVMEAKREGGKEFAKELASNIEDSFENEVARMGKAFDEWFSEMLTDLEEKKKDAAAGSKRMRKTVEGLTVQASGELVPDDTVVTSLEKEIQAKTEEVAKLREQQRNAEAQSKLLAEKKATAGKLDGHRSELTQAEADLAENQKASEGYVSESEKLAAQLEAVRKEIAVLESALPVARRDKENAEREMLENVQLERDRVKDAEASKAKAEAALAGHVSTTEELTRQAGEYKQKLNALEIERQEYERRAGEKLKSVEKINDELKCCPTCNRDADGWKAEARASFQREAEEFTKKARDLDGPIAEAGSLWKQAEDKRKAAQLLDDVAKTNRETVENAKAYIERMTGLFKRHESNAEKWSQANRDINEINAKLATERAKAQSLGEEHLASKTKDATNAGHLAKVTNAKSKIELMKQSIATAEAAQREVEQMGEVAPADTQGKISELQREIEALQQRHSRFTEAKAREASRLQAVGDAEKCEMEAEVYAGAIAIIGEHQLKLVDAAFAPVITKSAPICEPVLPGKFMFRDGDVGYMHAGKSLFVKYPALSDAEKLVVRVALGVALASESPLRILLVEELASVDREKKHALLSSLVAMVAAGVIDQVLITDPAYHDYDNPPVGVLVVKC